MKVVLFCGGYGMRMRQGDSDVPKPMVHVGNRPLLWHVMRYYAHYGHKDFILCLGYGANHIKDYFLNYEETKSNDFILRGGGAELQMLSNDIQDWTISFIDTGLETPIGERLWRVRDHLAGEPMFLANYADVLTDAPLGDMVAEMESAPQFAANLLAVPPQAAFHMVESDDDHVVHALSSVSTLGVRENGGYFVLRPEVLEELGQGKDLVGDALPRLASRGKVRSHSYDGFWMPADTVKERSQLERMYQAGERPWAVWEESRP